MENKQPNSLYERALECIENHLWNVDYPTEKEAVEAIAKSIEQLVLEEVGKAFDAGSLRTVWEECGTSSWEKPLDKQEYLNNYLNK